MNYGAAFRAALLFVGGLAATGTMVLATEARAVGVAQFAGAQLGIYVVLIILELAEFGAGAPDECDPHCSYCLATSAKKMLAHLTSLPEGWDGEGAPGIDEDLASYSCEYVLALADRFNLPKPDIVPTFEGGLQYEWEMMGFELELTFAPDRTLTVFMSDDATGFEAEALVPAA